jgi:hypothetical protein
VWWLCRWGDVMWLLWALLPSFVGIVWVSVVARVSGALW